ncbi:MAG: DUF3127 domain-containing protein [Bacteroidota bacterium]
MTIQGKLHKKFDTKQVSATFQKREFVIEFVENPLYPQYVSFQLIQEKCALIDPFQEGGMMQVDFNLRGREWTSPQGEVKYFNSLDAWRVSTVQQPAAAAGDPLPTPPPPEAIDASDMDDDDLPF